MKKDEFKKLSPLGQFVFLVEKTIQWLFALVVSGLVVLTILNWIF